MSSQQMEYTEHTEHKCSCQDTCLMPQEDGGDEADESKREIVKFIIGGLLAAAAFLAPSEPLKTVLFLLSYAVLGYGVLRRMVKNALGGSFFDENFLMGIATLGAIAIGEYPEAVGVMLFYGVGEYLEELAFAGSRKSITALIGVKPKTANIVTERGIVTVRPEDVETGSIIAVKPGERIPIDGIIEDGDTLLDMSALTGEPVPVLAGVGAEVLSGAINVTALVKIRTTKAYSDSAAGRILEAAFAASEKKAPAERFITKFSRYYTPAVVACAAVVAFVVPLVLGQPVSPWLHRGLVFLVVSCPCALVLSVPLAYFAGMGACSKNGVLVKGGGALDALAKLKTVVFDKTGTLTRGVFRVTSVVPAEGVSETELIEIAANIEAYSNHPIGRSIVSYCSEEYGKAPDTSSVFGFTETGGSGVEAVYNGRECRLGSAEFVRQAAGRFPEYDGVGSAVYISVDGAYRGYVAVSDVIKDDAASAVSRLAAYGAESVMLTGDKTAAARAVAGKLGITRVYAGLMPQEKLSKLEEIMAENGNLGNTAFAGDGINDAPALSRADISIAMGALGQDAAIEASDVVIMNDSPAKIADTLLTAKKIRVLVLENITFALGVKAVILVLGLLDMAGMGAAVFADVGVALLAVANSMRGRR